MTLISLSRFGRSENNLSFEFYYRNPRKSLSYGPKHSSDQLPMLVARSQGDITLGPDGR
jgi:hypothetical protein